MEIKKFQAAEVLPILRHNMRSQPDHRYGNESIDISLSHNNEILFSQGNSPEEINTHRKTLEKEVFCYNRKNIVKAVSVVIQLPDDCPPDQEEIFYRECYNFWRDKLPMGERCILLAAVHKDEIVTDPAGNRISHNHLHITFSPCVPDTKHDGYQFKLCADDLTRRSILKSLHPALQKHLDEAGVHATVYRGKSDSGERIKLSVAQLKEITRLTGATITRNMTVSDLADLMNTVCLQENQLAKLTADISKKEKQISELLQNEKNLISRHDAEIEKLNQEKKTVQNAYETAQQEITDLKKNLEAPKPEPEPKPERTFSWRSSQKQMESNVERSFEF